MSKDVVHHSNLTGCAILEKDKNGDVLLTWAYPSVTDDLRAVVSRRSGLQNQEIPLQFSYSKFRGTWVYSFATRGSLGKEGDEETSDLFDKLPRVVAFSVVLLASEFNPEMYGYLAGMLSSVYASSGNPLRVLEGYLSVFTRGALKINDSEKGKFIASDFDVRRSYIVTSLKDVINMFGVQIILAWSAMIMKKRIVVFCENPAILQKIIRAFPVFVWHRMDWNLLRPIVNMEEGELLDLKDAGSYVAGFTDPAIKLNEQYYDLLVDVNNRRVTHSSGAAAAFKMGAFHKDLATFLAQLGYHAVASGEDPEKSDQMLIKELALKTRDMLTKLKALQVETGTGVGVTLESLQARNLPPHMDRFLYAIARAEGLAALE